MNKVTLNANNLQGYFSPVGPLHSHHGEHLWPYDYVDRDSDTLLVTIGDSWTWGSGITGNYIEAGNLKKQENDFRLQHLYGGIIAKEKKCNWLNLGFYSAGNRWISNKNFHNLFIKWQHFNRTPWRAIYFKTPITSTVFHCMQPYTFVTQLFRSKCYHSAFIAIAA